MDAIRKKMQSLKGETDGLYATIQGFEDATKESNRLADQVEEDWCLAEDYYKFYFRLIVTSVTMARKFTALKLSLMRRMISCRKLLSLWRRRRNSSRKWSLMSLLFLVESC